MGDKSPKSINKKHKQKQAKARKAENRKQAMSATVGIGATASKRK